MHFGSLRSSDFSAQLIASQTTKQLTVLDCSSNKTAPGVCPVTLFGPGKLLSSGSGCFVSATVSLLHQLAWSAFANLGPKPALAAASKKRDRTQTRCCFSPFLNNCADCDALARFQQECWANTFFGPLFECPFSWPGGSSFGTM